MIDITQVKGIAFDVGGTLLRPWPSVGEIYAEVMGKYGHEHTADELDAAFAVIWKSAHTVERTGSDAAAEKRWWREIVWRVLDHLGHANDFDAMFDELWITFCDPNRWRLFDGVREILAELRGRGYQLAILSNWDERLRPLLEAMDLVDCFDEVVISSEVGVEKPHIEIFEIAAMRMALAPHELVHIGDSEHHDVEGATAAGWQCILVAPEKESDNGKLTDLNLLLEIFPGR